MSTPTSAWSLGGQSLAALPHHVSAAVLSTISAGGPLRLADSFARLPGGDDLQRISIPVERTAGPVLLISASDDGMWDSTLYSEVAADRLRAADHPYPWAHLVLEGAGHTIAGPPGRPFTSSTAPGPGVTFDMGGDPAVTTAARATAWERTIGFLREHLR